MERYVENQNEGGWCSRLSSAVMPSRAGEAAKQPITIFPINISDFHKSKF